MQEEKAIKFSVILPIYNVEKYLNRCMDSILNQTYDNLEIILVDDGSPDNCPLMCDEYAVSDSRIKVIHKQNAGLGMARNTGISNATGDYICFIDSDDFVSTNLFEICAKELQKELFDIIMFDAFDYVNCKAVKPYIHKEKQTFYGDEVRRVLLKSMIYDRDNKYGMRDCAWNKVYSMRLINKTGFRFVSEREYICEDYFSNLILFKTVESVMSLPDALYYYCYNESSLSHTYKDNRFEKLLFQYEQSILKCDELNYSESIKTAIAFQSFNNIINAFKLLISADSLSFSDKTRILKEVVCSEQYQSLYHQLTCSGEKTSRKVLIKALQNKMYILVYYLIKLKY